MFWLHSPTLSPEVATVMIIVIVIQVAKSCLILCDLTDYSMPGSFDLH